MRTLVLVRPGLLEWQDVPTPRLEADQDALVRPIAASACDLDRLVIAGATPFRGPFALGHECLAEVVDAGNAVKSVRVGQRVVVPWHIACGRCPSCTVGLTAHCESVPYGAMFGLPAGGEWGGVFADLLRVPFADAMLIPVPDGMDARAAVSAGDNLALAYEFLTPHLAAHPGAWVLILGFGSVGLYAVDLAAAFRAGRIVYVDDDGGRRQLAASLGAEPHDGVPSSGDGAFDILVDAGANEGWLRAALPLLVPEGICECPSIYFNNVELPLLPMAVRGVRFHIGRGNARPHVPDILDLIVAARIRPARVAAEIFPWDAAPEVLLDGLTKPVFVREGGAPGQRAQEATAFAFHSEVVDP